jgi:putative endonuclease
MVARAQASGERAEARAAALISASGLEILERNWSCRFGEIDLIARDRETVVFIEVRLRSDNRFGGARSSITREKQRRLVTAAQLWLSGYPGSPPCRFDVILADGDGALEWLRAAFDVSSN